MSSSGKQPGLEPGKTISTFPSLTRPCRPCLSMPWPYPALTGKGACSQAGKMASGKSGEGSLAEGMMPHLAQAGAQDLRAQHYH